MARGRAKQADLGRSRGDGRANRLVDRPDRQVAAVDGHRFDELESSVIASAGLKPGISDRSGQRVKERRAGRRLDGGVIAGDRPAQGDLLGGHGDESVGLGQHQAA